jgi:hypothetical protein
MPESPKKLTPDFRPWDPWTSLKSPEIVRKHQISLKNGPDRYIHVPRPKVSGKRSSSENAKKVALFDTIPEIQKNGVPEKRFFLHRVSNRK